MEAPSSTAEMGTPQVDGAGELPDPQRRAEAHDVSLGWEPCKKACRFQPVLFASQVVKTQGGQFAIGIKDACKWTPVFIL